MEQYNIVPERWIQYKACGKIIQGTKIICFKVPLTRSIQRKARVRKIWDIKALFKAIPKLGAIIDLTNTTRYYDPTELAIRGVLYKKIMIPGHEIPSEYKVRQFLATLHEFLNRTKNSLVGIHCTHGLNRTGYMVCRYMRDCLNMSAAEAIIKFERARGYEIERENYIADLLFNQPPPPNLGSHVTVQTTSSASHTVTSTSTSTNSD